MINLEALKLDLTTTKLLITFLILFGGYIISKLGSYVLLRIIRKRKDVLIHEEPVSKGFKYAVMTISIIVSLIYLRIDIFNVFLLNFYFLLPNIISVVLLVVLAVILINLIGFGIRRFFVTSGLTDFLMEYKREHILDIIISVIKLLLYIFVIIIAFNLMGIDISIITSTLYPVLYGVIFLLVLYIFVGTRDFVENYIVGIYLKSSKEFKLGQKVKIENEIGTIKSISNQNVTIQLESGYSAIIPNKDFSKNRTIIKKIKTDLETLGKIKAHFVEQKPSYCGPAAASMVLKIFGYNFSQERIGELCNTKVGVGTHPETLVKVIGGLTEKKVKGVWIDATKISDLKKELSAWLSDDALIIADYKKNILFPESKKAHYAVVLSVEGDEFVILDPSFTKGGVYLVESNRLFRGMDTYSPLIKGKRGYIVFAPEGTTAYHRIEEGLIYSNPDLYKKLSRRLKKELNGLLDRQQDILETVLPSKVKTFIRKWKERDKIARVWKPY